MFSIGNRVTNDLAYRVRNRNRGKYAIMTHVLKEDFQNTTSLLIDETRDTLHTTTTSETTNSLESVDESQTTLVWKKQYVRAW